MATLRSSLYGAAYTAHADIVRRAFVCAASRLTARGEPVHRAHIAAFRYHTAFSAHIILSIERDSGVEVRYGFFLSATELDAVTDEQIDRCSAHIAEQRYADDIRAYGRIVGAEDDLAYLRED